MIDIKVICIGDKVCYHSNTFENDIYENGVVKKIDIDSKRVWVVYHCNDDWDNYSHYTGECTELDDLEFGWR
jgi:hypothetical protein